MLGIRPILIPQLCLLLILAFVCIPVGAQASPSVESVEAEISKLENESPKDELLIAKYDKLRVQLNSFEKLKSERDNFQQIINQYPTLRERLNQQIENTDDLKIFATDKLRSYNDLTQAIASLQAAMSEWRSSYQSNSDQANKLNSDRTALPVSLAQQDKQIEQASLTTQSQESEIEQWSQSANLAELKLKREVTSFELQSLDERTELLRLEQKLLEKKIQTATPLIINLQERLTQVEQKSVRALIAEALDVSEKVEKDQPERQAAVDQLRQYAQELEKVLVDIDQARIETQKTEAQRRSLAEEQQLIKQNLAWLRNSTAFGASIRAQLRRLPNSVNSKTIPDTIANTHIRKYEISQLLTDYSLTTAVLASQPQAAPNDQLADLSNQLLTQLSQDYEKLIVALGKLQLSLNQYALEVEDARSFLREQQLWTRSNVPLWEHLASFNKTVWFGSPTPFASTMERLDTTKLTKVGALFIVYSLVFYFIYRKLTEHSLHKRDEFKAVFGHPVKDRFQNSVLLLLSTLIRAAIMPIWYLITAALLFWLLPSDNTNDFRTLIIGSAASLFVLEFSHTISSKKGLLELHLNWPESVCDYLHKHSKRVRWPFTLFLFVIFCVELVAQDQEAEASRVCFLIFILSLTAVYSALLKHHRVPTALPSSLGQGVGLMILRSLIMGSMLAIAIMAILGLYIAAWMLLVYQQATIFVALTILFIYQLGQRWLKLEHRQLNYQRLLARREELIALQQKQADEPPEIAELREDFPEVEEQGLASEQVSEQSLTLLRGLSVIGLVIAIITLWSSALEMTSLLNNVVVWQVSETISGSATLVDVTLQSLIYALITLLVTFVGVRNLPGILELLVLRRLELAPGTGYAVTTLLRYLILMTGVLSAFALLGFQWSRLQWLVAAFGVGLGFGLQEIFANFISGLILLFERPIRIGDIVTINDLSGTVSKIETRATTIIDWDNKEIVVPNKTFITEKLINWSLTDSITRIVIPIGVAYGSDVEKVEDLLYQSAQEHPLILNDPAPSVFFLAFGASSLDFELRIHINSIDHRLSTIHLVNKKIDQLFKQHGIEIAFPQMDVHVRDWPDAPDADTKQ
ncbi:mechanosensitive ion channel domain-containing protein [Vibrio ponticus]|uniref:mechanosensitive ion channel domain-containing protein n=1 Tax=Vibrio ponticus TaxID=265668 RepID=UPI001E45378F|nr:mechanosensitive ion channel domain-containing protein [Vibrio ponticus]